MKTTANIFFFILALVAWTRIAVSGRMSTVLAGVSTDSVVYLVSLFLSLAYLQWYLFRFLSPIHRMDSATRVRLAGVVTQKYKKGFFAGTIGLGYLLALLYAYELLDPVDTGNLPNFAFAALFFIVIGTLARSREFTVALVDELVDKEANTEQCGIPLTQVSK